MTETFLVAFWIFFATVGPLDVSALFAALTPNNTNQERRRTALIGTLIGGGILFFFAFLGDFVLAKLGISLAALRTAGGILLLLMAIEMVFARSSGATSTTDEETAEAEGSSDISVFPLATPLIAGPGAIGAVIVLMADAQGEGVKLLAVAIALAAILLLTFVLMLAATQVQRLLGVTGRHVIARIVGVLLAAMAVQFIFDGVADSGWL